MPRRRDRVSERDNDPEESGLLNSCTYLLGEIFNIRSPTMPKKALWLSFYIPLLLVVTLIKEFSMRYPNFSSQFQDRPKFLLEPVMADMTIAAFASCAYTVQEITKLSYITACLYALLVGVPVGVYSTILDTDDYLLLFFRIVFVAVAGYDKEKVPSPIALITMFTSLNGIIACVKHLSQDLSRHEPTFMLASYFVTAVWIALDLFPRSRAIRSTTPYVAFHWLIISLNCIYSYSYITLLRKQPRLSGTSLVVSVLRVDSLLAWLSMYKIIQSVSVTTDVTQADAEKWFVIYTVPELILFCLTAARIYISIHPV